MAPKAENKDLPLAWLGGITLILWLAPINPELNPVVGLILSAFLSLPIYFFVNFFWQEIRKSAIRDHKSEEESQN